MKYKAADLVKFLGITNVAEETCYKLITTNKLKSHFEVIPLLMKEKPSLELWQIAKLCFIPDVSDSWVKWLGGKSDLHDSYFPGELRRYKGDIEFATQFFTVLHRENKQMTVDIAVHGGLGQFGSREQFVMLCNGLEANIVNTVLKSSVTNSVAFLVTYQPNDTSCRKVRDADMKGVRKCTPEEYLSFLAVQAGEYLARNLK
jgi:hypothetical protein